MENNEPKKKFEWSYLYKVYIVLLIVVFIFAWSNMAHAGVFLDINNNMEYVDSQMPLSDIMSNSDTWDAVSNYMNDVHGVPFPSYSDATAMDDLLENVLMFYVGQYCNLSGTAATAVYDACMDVSDAANTVWDLITLDLGSGDFEVSPSNSGDLSNVIHGVVDPLIYSTPSQTVGNWVSVPCNTSRLTVNGTTYWEEFVSEGVAYATIVKSGSNYGIIMASFVNGTVVQRYENYLPSGRYLMATYTLSTKYQGSESVGFYSSYYTGEPFTLVGSSGYYSSLDSALAELFGWNGSSDPVLNGDGYIINENPTYAPLSGYSALNYPYRTKIVENHTNTTDPDDPVEYPEGVNEVEPNSTWTDIPTWLVDPSIDFPEEPDYLENVNITQPEFESDNSFLESVYGSLPSGIVLMISISLGLGIAVRIIS